MPEDIRIALIDDDAPFRSSLRLLISGSPGFACCGEWPTVEAAVASPKLGLADLLLLDIHLPGVDGDEGVGLVLDSHPGLTVLMFTAYGDDQRVFRSLCRGACGYLLKSTMPARLLEALAEAHAGGSPMSPEIARKVVRLFRQTATEPAETHGLTPREIELLALLADGHSYQSAAGGLGITANTVRTYIRSIYEKMHVHTQSAAVSKALRAGLI
jgi:DNA-binding NarL/FixJ family response regulator